MSEASASALHLQIIEQHKSLLREVEQMRSLLGTDRPPSLHLAALHDALTQLLGNLEEHFHLESSSTMVAGRDVYSEPKLAELRALDAEHPELLRLFGAALEASKPNSPRAGDLVDLVSEAIDAFLTHEAREDLLFQEDED